MGAGRWRYLALVAAVGSACAAPGDGVPAQWEGTVERLPGGGALVRNTGRGAWGPSDAWRFAADLRIGSATAEGPTSFSQILGVAVDGAGRIYVLDRQAQEVRVFDSTGAYVRTIGRRGGGPGEFENANGLAFDPRGRLWIVDQQSMRNTIVDTAGRLVATVRRPVTPGYGWRWQGAFDDVGRVYEPDYLPGETRERILVRFDSALRAADTLRLPQYRRPTLIFRRGAGMVGVADVPYTPQPVMRVDRRGDLWFGEGREYRVYRRRPGGDTVLIIEHAMPRVPVTTEERDSAIARLGPLAVGAEPVDYSVIPRVKPAYSTFIVGEDGHVFVFPHAAASDTGRVVDVFDPTGRYLGRATSDVRFISWAPLVVRGDRWYTVTEDEDGAQVVVRVRLIRVHRP